jgi:hypothetical protein
MSLRVVGFDCESDGLPARPPPGAHGIYDALDFRHVQCTVACAIAIDVPTPFDGNLKSLVHTRISAWRDDNGPPFETILKQFDDADVIIGYNALGFDFPLMYKYYNCHRADGRRRYMQHRCKTVDIFERIRSATTQWPKLDTLLASNNLQGKTSSGKSAVTMWEQQERTQLCDYCMNDVDRTLQLAALPSITMGSLVIPEHVYGLRSALQSRVVRSRD